MQRGPSLVLRHHLILDLFILYFLVFPWLLFGLVLLVKKNTLLELLGVLVKQGMTSDICKCHSFLRIDHKYSLKEILHIRRNLFKLLSFRYYCLDIEEGVASANNICFHVVA